jgi:hypothetical protein
MIPPLKCLIVNPSLLRLQTQTLLPIKRSLGLQLFILVVAVEKEVAAREEERGAELRKMEESTGFVVAGWIVKMIFRIAKQNMPERSCGKESKFSEIDKQKNRKTEDVYPDAGVDASYQWRWIAIVCKIVSKKCWSCSKYGDIIVQRKVCVTVYRRKERIGHRAASMAC